MKRKITIIGIVALILVILTVWAVPAFAADPPGATTSKTPLLDRMRPFARLLLVNDPAKVDALIAKALTDGKLTADQATKVKTFWTANHARFTRNFVMTRLLRSPDKTKVQAFLDKAVAAGKIQQDRADKVLQVWDILHTPAPAVTQ